VSSFKDDDVNPKDLKVEFAPGCFDDFEGTQEELDALMAEIIAKVHSGQLMEEAVPVDFDDEDMDYLHNLIEAKLAAGDNGTTKKKLH
jgi:hypothetical protein